MEPHFGYELKFLSFAFKNRFLRPLEYVLKGWKTLMLFLRQKPQIIWVQLPPTPILHLAYFYKIVFSRQVAIIADCHNATFRSPWINFPGAVSLLNRCNLLVLVHNDSVKEQAVTMGVLHEHLYVLEDPPALLNPGTGQHQEIFSHPWILYPCSYNRDEPIQAVLDSARLVPQITFVLTGNPARAQNIHDLRDIPPNVKLTGFLPIAEFDRLLCNTDAVLCLTKLDGIQLSGANEAVVAGKPMVLSNTKLLKKLFYKGAIYVDSLDPRSLAQGCEEALSRQNGLTQEVHALREERSQRWLEQSSKVDLALRDILR
jgi:glycosyltransferase involved in cell wall biosynthesis